MNNLDAVLAARWGDEPADGPAAAATADGAAGGVDTAPRAAGNGVPDTTPARAPEAAPEPVPGAAREPATPTPDDGAIPAAAHAPERPATDEVAREGATASSDAPPRPDAAPGDTASATPEAPLGAGHAVPERELPAPDDLPTPDGAPAAEGEPVDALPQSAEATQADLGTVRGESAPAAEADSAHDQPTQRFAVADVDDAAGEPTQRFAAVDVDDAAGEPTQQLGAHPAGAAAATAELPRAAEAPPVADAPPASDAPPAAQDTPPPPGSPLDQFEAEQPRRRSKRGLVVAAIVVLVAVVAYGVGAWFFGGRIPSGTVVAGVPIGGLSADAARDRLDTELAALQTEQVPVSVGEALSSVDPAAAGLTFDVDATLDNLTGFTLNPRVLWGRVFGMGEAPVISTVDEDGLRAELKAASSEVNLAAVEGVIAFEGAVPQVTEPVAGKEVDLDAAQSFLQEEWLTAERPLELPTDEVQPTIGEDAVQDALTTLAEPLVSAPVAVSVEGHVAELSPEKLASAARFVADGDALALEMDGKVLAAAVAEVDPEIGVAGEDARIVLGANAQPEIIPSTSGRGLDPEALAEAVRTAGTSSNRTAEAQLVDAEPEFTTAEAEALGVKEIIVDFSTPMPYDPVRTENLKVGAAKVTGTLVMPGEEFSLLKALGPITAENGFVSSGVVEDGFSTTALGGGLSQLSTNTFNVGYLAGMDDVTHQPHSRWFDRYPAGREATLWEPSVDMIWRNNTDYGILVHAWVTSDAVHTRLWSTKVWDVKTTTSAHYNITKPTTVYNPAEECVSESGGKNGFTVTVNRQRFRDGALVDDKDMSWTYRPWHRVVCGQAPSATAAPETPSATPEG
ncbi:VanW family protein [Georgenia sp. SYP-B2076]|uniref:VanW family protein n=1 Tax=Georgenia sp. SYP-B2076 TaxID=2495881 RepID=UPI000F8D6797|nr:VanW family protein [Georgenia sp. SYP-B2076]